MDSSQHPLIDKQAGMLGDIWDSIHKFLGRNAGRVSRGFGRIKDSYKEGVRYGTSLGKGLMPEVKLQRYSQLYGIGPGARAAWGEAGKAGKLAWNKAWEHPITTMTGVNAGSFLLGRQLLKRRQNRQAELSNGLGKTGSVHRPQYKDALLMIKLAEEKSYEDYESEYLNDPERQKLLNKGKTLLPTLLTIMGAYGGGLIGTGISSIKSMRNGGNGSPSALGAGTGALIGALLGNLGGRYAYNNARDITMQHLRDEAWRYAMMKSQGKFDPSKTLV